MHDHQPGITWTSQGFPDDLSGNESTCPMAVTSDNNVKSGTAGKLGGGGSL